MSVISFCDMYTFHFLRILASYEAKTAKICNFWTIWPVIQLILNVNALFTTKDHCSEKCLSDCKKVVY